MERHRGGPTIGAWLRRSRKRHQVVIVSKGGHPEIKSWPPDMHAFRLSREEMTPNEVWKNW